VEREMDEVQSLYEHTGGEEALHRLEEVFYSKPLADPVPRHFSLNGGRTTSIA